MTNIIEGITLLGEHTGLVIIGCLELLAALFLVLSFFGKRRGSGTLWYFDWGLWQWYCCYCFW